MDGAKLKRRLVPFPSSNFSLSLAVGCQWIARLWLGVLEKPFDNSGVFRSFCVVPRL